MRRLAIWIVLSIVAAACSGSGGDGSTTTGAVPRPSAVSGTSSLPPASSTVTTESVVGPSPTSTTITFVPVGTLVEPPPFDTWTAILASLPTDEFDNSEAVTTAFEFKAANSGVVLSDDYPSLNPGFWAVFSGSYDYAWEAAQRCARLAEREVNPITDCYPRYLGIDPARPIHRDEGLALARDNEGFVVAVSTENGQIVRTVVPRGLEAASPSSPQLSPRGTEAFYSVLVEDSWFSCEASDGLLVRLDLATGDAVEIGDGFSPRVSADGRTLLYLEASDCFSDPEEPHFVRAPIDTIVIRDLTTGRERRHAVPRPAAAESTYELWTVSWGPTADEIYVGDTEGSVRRFSAEFGGPAVGDEVIRIPDASWNWSFVGFHNSSTQLLVEVNHRQDGVESVALMGISLGDGAVDLTEIERYEGPAAFGLDRSGDHIITATPGRVIVDGREMAVDGRFALIDW